jgi:hypothetical protein
MQFERVKRASVVRLVGRRASEFVVRSEPSAVTVFSKRSLSCGYAMRLESSAVIAVGKKRSASNARVAMLVCFESRVDNCPT